MRYEDQKFMDKFTAITDLYTLDLSNLEKPFKCIVCGNRFLTDCNAHRHIENYHSNEWVGNRDQIIIKRLT